MKPVYTFEVRTVRNFKPSGRNSIRIDLAELRIDLFSNLPASLDALYAAHWQAIFTLEIDDDDAAGNATIEEVIMLGSDDESLIRLPLDQTNQFELEAEIERMIDWGTYCAEERAARAEYYADMQEDR